MNAHINLDLGIAAAQVSPGNQLPQLKPDFDQINAVLASMVSTVASEIAVVSPLLGDLETIGLRCATPAINFDIVAARDAAWLTAERLNAEPPRLHALTIGALDLAVSIQGRAILYPDNANECLKTIQEAKVKTSAWLSRRYPKAPLRQLQLPRRVLKHRLIAISRGQAVPFRFRRTSQIEMCLDRLGLLPQKFLLGLSRGNALTSKQSVDFPPFPVAVTPIKMFDRAFPKGVKGPVSD